MMNDLPYSTFTPFTSPWQAILFLRVIWYWGSFFCFFSPFFIFFYLNNSAHKKIQVMFFSMYAWNFNVHIERGLGESFHPSELLFSLENVGLEFGSFNLVFFFGGRGRHFWNRTLNFSERSAYKFHRLITHMCVSMVLERYQIGYAIPTEVLGWKRG